MSPSMNDFKLNAFSYMLKGEVGTRKSTAALSFALAESNRNPKAARRQYWFSQDKKMGSIVLPSKLWGVNLVNLDYDNYKDYAAMETKLKALQTNCPYDDIILDSITSTGDSINMQTRELKAGTTRVDGSEKGKKIGGIEVDGLEDYKAEAAAFTEITAILEDIKLFFNVNIIFVAHVIGTRTPEDKAQNTHFARIIVTGGKAISAKIPAYCEEVYHFNVKGAIDTSKEGEYACVTQHTGDDFARTCLPLTKEIVFNNRPLYVDFIQPAIKKLIEQKPITRF